MRDILDAADTWIGTPGGAAEFGNKQPVAIDDDISLLQDSGPVTIDVLANDFDPEGAPLTLISVSAALGTAVAEADDTVTYSPPPGISGFDTLVYEIADDLDLRRTGQVNITITEPQLSMATLPDNTLEVTAETGTVDITVTDPPAFAGNWQIPTTDLASGPVNLVVPDFSGTIATGQTLTASGGLWVYDTGAGALTQTWQWRRNGTDIAGATAAGYLVQAADLGQSLTVVETQSDSFGQRAATSLPQGGFTPAADTAVIGWWDASDAGTITDSAGEVSVWTDKAGGASLIQSGSTPRPRTGLRTLNGLNVLDFQGSDFLEATSRSFPASGDVAFHAVVVIDAVSNAFEALFAVEAVNDFQIDANNASQFDGRLNASGIGSALTLTGGPFAGALILSVVFDQTGSATAEVFVGGTTRGSTGYTQPIDSTAALHLMTNRSKNAWSDGAVAELIITGDVSNRTSHHAYLAAKWGIS